VRENRMGWIVVELKEEARVRREESWMGDGRESERGDESRGREEIT
jgi:hypothetical protein